jgi:hypothetical protein
MTTIPDEIYAQYPICTEDVNNGVYERIASQYKESEKLLALIQGLCLEAGKITCAMCEALIYRWIDTAEGVNLDALGDIVGQPRLSAVGLADVYFGYDGNVFATAYGSGRYIAPGESTTGSKVLEDPEYRLFIRAKAFANQSASTPDEIAQHIFLVFGKKPAIQNGRAQLDIYFFDTLTPTEIAMLNFQWVDQRGQTRDFFPYTLGVGQKIFFDAAIGPVYGYSGNPLANPYGTGYYKKQLSP